MNTIKWNLVPDAEYWCENQFFKTIDGEFYCRAEDDRSWRRPAYKSPENFSWWGRAIARPAIWTVSGLPPIGTECEAKNHLSGDWLAVKIIDHQGSVNSAVCREICTDKLWWSDSFRPVRTAEEIAAEEREISIQAMCEFGVDAGDDTIYLTVSALYDAGCRMSAKP